MNLSDKNSIEETVFYGVSCLLTSQLFPNSSGFVQLRLHSYDFVLGPCLLDLKHGIPGHLGCVDVVFRCNLSTVLLVCLVAVVVIAGDNGARLATLLGVPDELFIMGTDTKPRDGEKKMFKNKVEERSLRSTKAHSVKRSREF